MEYKAISQASYKFTSTRETTIQGADVLNSGFRFGTIKTTGNNVLQILPSCGSTSHTIQEISLKNQTISNDPTYRAYCNGYLYPVTVDNETYYGTKSSQFVFGNYEELKLAGTTFTLKAGTLKVLRYDNAIKNIVLDEYSTANVSSGSLSSGVSSYSYVYLEVYKQTDDVILAVWWEEEATTTTSE